MKESGTDDLGATMSRYAAEFTERLSQLVTTRGDSPAELEAAVRYSLLASGKRLRPFLVNACCVLAGGKADDAFAPAAALEMVHAFSLIHDDLPAMDDDDLRRGRPTCHKVYGEATAILAGDALLALAFETLATGVDEPGPARELIRELAVATGWCGMIGGQAADLAGEHQPPSLDRVQYIHERKTGALIRAACRMGALAGNAERLVIERLDTYGRHLGLAFQIADDLLDVTAQPEQLGKSVGQDAKHGKQTYPACVGTEASRHAADEAVAAALAALAGYGPEADRLRELARFVVARDR